MYNCRLIVGENLTQLTTIGRGRGVRGRFRNWRNNSQVRGELWRCLSYKCHLARDQNAYRRTEGHDLHLSTDVTGPPEPSPPLPRRIEKKPRTGDPGSAAKTWTASGMGPGTMRRAMNIAGLGMAFLVHYCETQEYRGFRMTSNEVKPCSYRGQREAPLLRPQGITPRPKRGQTHLLCRLVFDRTSMHISERSNAFLALYFPIQETRASQCIKCMIVACFQGLRFCNSSVSPVSAPPLVSLQKSSCTLVASAYRKEPYPP